MGIHDWLVNHWVARAVGESATLITPDGSLKSCSQHPLLQFLSSPLGAARAFFLPLQTLPALVQQGLGAVRGPAWKVLPTTPSSWLVGLLLISEFCCHPLVTLSLKGVLFQHE